MSMKEATGWVCMFFLIIALTACQSLPGTKEPTNRYAAAAAGLDTVQRALVIAIDTKLLDDEEIVTVGYYCDVARTGLATMKAQLPQGGTAFEDALELVNAVVTKLQALEAEARTRKERAHGPTADNRVDQTECGHWQFRVQGVSGVEGREHAHSGADRGDRSIVGRIHPDAGYAREGCSIAA